MISLFAISIVLVIVAIQDFRTRSFSIMVVPVLLLCILIYNAHLFTSTLVFQEVLFRLLLPSILFLTLQIYYIVRFKQFKSFVDRAMGLGDVVLILLLSFLFESYLLIILLGSASLLGVAVAHLPIKSISKKEIPFAGFLSALAIPLLFYHHLS